MESIPYALNKIMIERATSDGLRTNRQPEQDAPPSYTASEQTSPPAYGSLRQSPNTRPQPAIRSSTDPYPTVDSYDLYEDPDSDPSPVTLTLDAGTKVHGQGNVISPSLYPSGLSDATRFSAILLSAIQKLNSAVDSSVGAEEHYPRPRLHVNLTVQTGLTIHGDKNIVGNVVVNKNPNAQPGEPCPGLAGTQVLVPSMEETAQSQSGPVLDQPPEPVPQQGQKRRADDDNDPPGKRERTE